MYKINRIIFNSPRDILEVSGGCREYTRRHAQKKFEKNPGKNLVNHILIVILR